MRKQKVQLEVGPVKFRNTDFSVSYPGNTGDDWGEIIAAHIATFGQAEVGEALDKALCLTPQVAKARKVLADACETIGVGKLTASGDIAKITAYAKAAKTGKGRDMVLATLTSDDVKKVEELYGILAIACGTYQ